MRNHRLTAISLTIFLFACNALTSVAQGRWGKTVNFSGMDQFWKIVDSMEKDIEPTEEQWNALFRTPGYSYLVNVEHKNDLFKRLFPLVFMPSRQHELEKKLEEDNMDAKYYLPHYLKVKENRAGLIKLQSEFENKDLLGEALKRTRQYLPPGVIERFPPPTVAFVIFEPDGHADPSVIAIDLLYALNKDDLIGFIGHEAHHYYLGTIAKGKLPDRNSDEYYLFRSINQLRLEGMGDLIDKTDILNEKADPGKDEKAQRYRKDFRRLYYETPETFRRIDQLISEISDDPSKMKENARKVWDLLPYGAHPSGYFMSRALVDHVGRNVLIKEMVNPFAFIRLYNKVAKKAMKKSQGKYYVFSDKTMDFLSKFEKQYVSQSRKPNITHAAQQLIQPDASIVFLSTLISPVCQNDTR